MLGKDLLISFRCYIALADDRLLHRFTCQLAFQIVGIFIHTTRANKKHTRRYLWNQHCRVKKCIKRKNRGRFSFSYFCVLVRFLYFANMESIMISAQKLYQQVLPFLQFWSICQLKKWKQKKLSHTFSQNNSLRFLWIAHLLPS